MKRPENATTLACGLAGELIRTFGEVRLRALGTSMVPSILPGDLISVQRAGLSEISTGEIVLYSREGRLFAHRVVARTGSHDDPRLITRGDRLCHNDPPVSSSELLGRLTSVQCGDGRSHRQLQAVDRRNVWGQMIVRVLRTSDQATYLYLRLATLWGGFVGRTFRSDNEVRPGEGFLIPEGSGAKVLNSLAINVGVKVVDPGPVGAPNHKASESAVARVQTQCTEGVAECRA
jgi:signal peptidase I